MGFTSKRQEIQEDETQTAESVRSVGVFKTMNTQRKMRLLSEAALDEVLPWHLEKGTAYHIISAGDVDSLTYLRHIAKEQHINLLVLSTWCMATSDAEEIEGYIEKGVLDRAEFYVGEIFKNGYRGCIDVLCRIAEKTGGRVARFRNHSKIMLIFGDKYTAVVESSANVDTNPRTEQTCITVDHDLAVFYKEYYDKINDFDGRFKEWKPWQMLKN